MQIEGQVVRLELAAGSPNAGKNLLSGGTPIIWTRTTVRLDIGVILNGALVDPSNWVSLTVEVDGSQYPVSDPAIQKQVTVFDAAATLAAWRAGTAQHCTVVLSDVDTNLALGAKEKDYFLTVRIITVAGGKLIAGWAALKLKESNAGAAAPAPEIVDTFYTAAETDALLAARILKAGAPANFRQNADGNLQIYDPSNPATPWRTLLIEESALALGPNEA